MMAVLSLITTLILNQEVVISNNSEGYFLINLPFKASIDGNFSLSLQYNIND